MTTKKTTNQYLKTLPPGRGNINENNFKTKTNQPDGTGFQRCPACELIMRVSAWLKSTRYNTTSFSLSIQPLSPDAQKDLTWVPEHDE